MNSIDRQKLIRLLNEDNGYVERQQAELLADKLISNGIGFVNINSNVLDNLKMINNNEQCKFSVGLEYAEENDGSLSIIGFGDCVDDVIIIPSHYHDKPIKNIANYAFKECKCTKVIIPDTVVSIEMHAFSSCNNLIEICLSNNLISIGEEAFSGCVSLQMLIIPNSVCSIGKYAFSRCNQLKQIKLPLSITKISEGMFSNCWQLENIEIPPNVKIIEFQAFRSCKTLKTIIFPESLMQISHYNFENCSLLSSALFGNANNWYLIYVGRFGRTEKKVDVRNKAIAAQLLKESYTHFWVRKSNK